MIRSGIIATLGLYATLTAQTHTRTDLVQGQLATFTVTNAPATGVVTHWLGFNGLGKGICFPAPFNVCFDMQGVPLLLHVGVSDPNGKHELTFPMPANAPLIPLASQALTLNLPTLFTSKTNALNGTIKTIAALDDDFSGSSLAQVWQFVDPTTQTHAVTAGQLRMRPTKTGIERIWFLDNRGPFVHRLVSGDFTVVTKLDVVDPTNPAFPPAPTCRVGGLMVRDPASRKGDENWIYLLLGGGIPSIPLALEDKTTVKSKSDFRFWPVLFWKDARLRIQRRGRTVSLSYQEPGKTTWTALRTHDRPDFPATLQVGLVVFSLDAPPNVEARFDEIRFTK